MEFVRPPPSLREARSTLYEAFSIFPVPFDLEGCPHCVADEESAFLASQPLSELLEVDLERFMWKAMTTWGTVDDFRYFLPRLVELANGGLCWDLGLLRSKLDYGDWELWPQPMQDAVYEYLLAWWWDVESGGQSEGGTACAVLSEFLDFGFELAVLLSAWELPAFREDMNSSVVRRRALSFAHFLESGEWRRVEEASLFLPDPAAEQLGLWLMSERPLDLLYWATAEHNSAGVEKKTLSDAVSTLRRWRQ